MRALMEVDSQPSTSAATRKQEHEMVDLTADSSGSSSVRMVPEQDIILSGDSSARDTTDSSPVTSPDPMPINRDKDNTPLQVTPEKLRESLARTQKKMEADKGRVFSPTMPALGDGLIDDIRDSLRREVESRTERESNPQHHLPSSYHHVLPEVENERGVAQAFETIGVWVPQYRGDESETGHVSQMRVNQISQLLPKAAERAESVARPNPDAQMQIYQKARLSHSRDILSELEAFMEVQMAQITEDMAARDTAETKRLVLTREITHFHKKVERVVAEVQGVTMERFCGIPHGFPRGNAEQKTSFIHEQRRLNQQLRGITIIARNNDNALNIALTSLNTLVETGRGDVSLTSDSDE